MTTSYLMLSPGTPNYTPGFAQQSSAVIVDEQPYLIDCGDGIMTRIAEAASKGLPGMKWPKLTRLFITHLHPDHTAGLPGLIMGPWVLHREEPFQIYGPKGTQKLVDSILAGYEYGIAEHRDGLAPINSPLVVEVHEIEPGEIYKDERVTVTAFQVSHGGLEAYGLRFVSAEKTIIHSGDTCPVPSLIEHARGCDILVHEVYMAASLSGRSEAWQKYHTTVHTSGIQLAAIAEIIRPKLLVLNHQLIWGDYTDDDLLAEIREHYDGEVVSSKDLDHFT